MGCKDQQDILIDGGQKYSISALRDDFKNQTGYDKSNKYFLMPSFKTDLNWDKVIEKSNDTLYVKVNVLDSVLFSVGDRLVDVENKVWVRAVRKADSKTNYSLLIFAPVDSATTFNGLIFSKSLNNNRIVEAYFNNSTKVSKSSFLSRVKNTS
ncbi:hypothetical protein GCM10017764_10960 [Sphingobacterium griseoflavum]|uniref:Uncharacterized protein n=2 Tax=Sphingobacterium griseoflavum TaxID=1474952 RepID=A0ABQ3HUU3_9SPHI|nr:hypothetical protein GCM10017764_10960 [Sphingobacterium griseoflavum]